MTEKCKSNQYYYKRCDFRYIIIFLHIYRFSIYYFPCLLLVRTFHTHFVLRSVPWLSAALNFVPKSMKINLTMLHSSTSHRGHGCLSVLNVECCQVESSATSRSLVQRSPTDCGASLCVIE
jgi:hypothetical protein